MRSPHLLRIISCPSAHLLNKNEQDIHSIVNQVAHLTNQINGLLASNRDKIDTTIATVQAGVEQIPQLLSDVRTVLANVQDISKKIKRAGGRLGRGLWMKRCTLKFSGYWTLQRIWYNT